ncbi:myb-like protein U [Adelges cooleyi]|uniref:myb-like protein U n=1 Tax=Adelges cooleyi TaxID=133065 RepID=UPI00218046A5|nr:myb-like protein U [Adelges cooleyi]
MASSSKQNSKSNRPPNGGSLKQHQQKDVPGPPSSSLYCNCGGGNYLGNIRTISIYECHRSLECLKTQTNTLMVFLSQTYYNKLKAFECLTRDKSKKYENKVLELISIWENCRNIFLDDPCVGTDAFMQHATCESALLLFEPKWEDVYTKTKKNFIVVLNKILLKLQTMKYCQDATKNCQWLMSSINDPWTNYHFQRLLCLDSLEPDEMGRYLNFENIKLFALRVRLLCESKCEKEALKLSSLAMQFYNRQTISKFYSGLNDIELIRDIYFACLHRLNKKEELVNQLKKFTPKEDGKNLMDRCTKKIKYFAFKKEAQPRICQHMVYVCEMAACILVAKSLANIDYLDDFTCLVNNWSTIFITLMRSDLKTELNDISLCNVIRYFIKLAPTANHIYILCDILKNKFGSMLPQALYIEMHVKALATNINEKEKYKQLNEKEKALESLKSLVQGYLKLANLLENDLSLCCECVLTAYSLMPSNDLLARIEYLAVQSGKWFPEHPTNVPENSCDKNSKTSRVNPKGVNRNTFDVVNSKSKKSEEPKSVKCAIKKNNSKLSKRVKKPPLILSQHLHSDLIAVINNPRYEPFKWKLKWPELKAMCKQYLEDLDLVLLRNTQYPKLNFLKFEYDDFHVPKLENLPDNIDVKQILYYDTEYLSDDDTESIESNNSSLDFYVDIDINEPLDIVTRNRRSLQTLKNNYEENDKSAVSSLLKNNESPDFQSRLSDYKCDNSVDSILKEEIKINAKKLAGKPKLPPPKSKVKRKITKSIDDLWCPRKANRKNRNKNSLIRKVPQNRKTTSRKSSDKNIDSKFKDSQNNNDIVDKHSKKKHLNRMLSDRLPHLNSLDYLVPGNTNHIVNVVQIQATANSLTNVSQSPQTVPISNHCSTNSDTEKTISNSNQTKCTRSLNNFVSVCQSIKSQPNKEKNYQGECSFTGSMTVSNSATQHEINQPDKICRDVPIQNVNSGTICWEDLQLHQPNDPSMNISNTVNLSSSSNVIVRTSDVTLPIFSTHTTGQQIHTTDSSGKKTIYCIKAGNQYVDLALATENKSLSVNSNNYSINVPVEMVPTTTQTTAASLYTMSAQPHVSVRTSISSPMLRSLVNARCHPTTIAMSSGNNTQAYTYVSSSNLNSPGTSKTSEPIVLSSIINKAAGTSGIITSTPASVYGKQTKSNTSIAMAAAESERAFNAAISSMQTINPTVSSPNTSVISLMIAGSTPNQILKSNNSLYVVAAQNPGIATQQRSSFIAQHCDKTLTPQILRLQDEQKKNDNLKLVSQTFTATSEAIQFVTSNTERLLQCIEKNSNPSNLTDLLPNPSEGSSNIIHPGENKKSATTKRGTLKTYESKTKALKEANISDMFVFEKGTLYAVQDESVGQLNSSKSQTVASTKPSVSNKMAQNKRQRETIEKPKISPNASPNVTITGSMLPRFQQAFGKAKFSHNSAVINDNKFSNTSVIINDKFSHSTSNINDDNKFSNSAAVISDNKLSHSAAVVKNNKFSHSAAIVNDNKFSPSAALINDNKFSHSAAVVNDNKFSHSPAIVNDNKFSHNSAAVGDNSTLSSTNLQNSLSLSPGLIVNKTPLPVARVYSTSKGVQTNTDSEPCIISNITPLNSVANKTQRVSVTTNQNNILSIGGHNKSNVIMTCKTSLPMKSIAQQLSSSSHQHHSGNIIDSNNIKKENVITSVAKVITPFATTISNSSAGTSTPNVVYTIPIQTASDLKTGRSVISSMQGLAHVQRQLKVSPSIIQSVLRKHPNLQQSFIRHGKQNIEVQATSTGERLVPMSVSNLLKTAIETSNAESKVAVNSSKSNVTEETMEQVREFESVLEEVRKKSLMNEMCTSGNMLTQINHDLLHSPSENVDLITTENSQTPMFSLNKNTFSFLNQTIANQTMIKEEDSADTNNCGGDRLQKTTPIIVRSVTPTSSTSSAAVSPSSSSSTNNTTPKPVDRLTQCSNPIATIPKPLPPVAVIKTPNDSPTTSTVKIPVLQKPMPKLQEDEQTTQRIYAILDKYAEQLRNSPELKNKPAPRRRTNPPTNPSPNVKRKKPSQLNLKTSSQQTSCSSSGMEMSPTSDMQAIDSEDSSNAVSQFSHIMGSPSRHSDEQNMPTVITETPTTENNPVVNLIGDASEKQEIKVESDVKPTVVAQANQIVVNAGSSGPFLSLPEGSTGNVRLLVASSKTSKMYQLHCPVGAHGGPVIFQQITAKDPKSTDLKITAANILGQNLSESSLLSALTNNTIQSSTTTPLGNEIFLNTSQSSSSKKSSKAVDIISTPRLVRNELIGDIKKQIKLPVTKKSQGSQSTFDDDIVNAQQGKLKSELIDRVALPETQNLATEKIDIVKNEEVDISNEQQRPVKNSDALTTGNNDQEMFEKEDVRMSAYFSVKTPNTCAANIQYHIGSSVEVKPDVRQSTPENPSTNILLEDCKTEDKLTIQKNDKQPIKNEDNSLKLEPEIDIIDNSKELKISQKEEENKPNIDQINAAAAAEIISTVKKSNDAYKQNNKILPKDDWKKDDENEKCLNNTVFDMLHCQSISTNTKIGSLAFRLKNDASAENWHKCLSKVIPPGTEKMLEGENLKQLQSVFQTAKIKTYKDLKVFMIEQCKKIDNNVASALKEYNLYDDIEDLGVDKPSTSELFPDVAILNDFDKSVSPTHNLSQGSTSKLNDSSTLQGKRKSVLSHTTNTLDNEQPTSSGSKKNRQRVSFLKQALINEMNQDSSDYEHKLLFVNGNNKTSLVVSNQNDLCPESPSNIMIADSETCMSEDSTSTMSSGTPHYNFRRSKRKNVEQDGFIESQVIKRMYRGRVTEDEDEPTAKNEPQKNDEPSKTQSSGQKSTPQKKPNNNNRRLSSRLRNSNTTKKKKSPSKSPQREKSPPQKPVTTTRTSLRRVSRRTI